MAGEKESYSDQCLAQFLKRSYAAVDGLWFVKVEETSGFEHALELDRQVWAVMAKIQARKARELLGVDDNTPADLARCVGLKFLGDGQDADISHTNGGVRVRLPACMWFDVMQRAGREDVARRIGEVICPTEMAVWAQEFGGGYEVNIPRRLCAGCECCEIVFTTTGQSGGGHDAEERAQ